MTGENRNIRDTVRTLPSDHFIEPLRTHAPARNGDDAPRRQEEVDGVGQDEDKAVGFGVGG